MIKKLLLFFLFLSFLACGLCKYALSKFASLQARTRGTRYEERRNQFKSIFKKLGPQAINFQTTDGIVLSGAIIVRPQAQYVLLFCHGYRQSKEFLAPVATLFTQQTLCLFDFRAQGDSQGDKITWGDQEYRDVAAALAFLATDPSTRELPVIAIGYSMGAAALVKACAHGARCKALVLDSCYADFSEQSQRLFSGIFKLPAVFGHLFRSILVMTKMISFPSTVHDIATSDIPVLIIHSQDDTVVPVSDAQRLYDASVSNLKELWIAPHGEHTLVYQANKQEYRKRILGFIEALPD